MRRDKSCMHPEIYHVMYHNDNLTKVCMWPPKLKIKKIYKRKYEC